MDEFASQSNPRPKASGNRPFPPPAEEAPWLTKDLNWLKPLLFIIILDFFCDWIYIFLQSVSINFSFINFHVFFQKHLHN